MGVKAGDKKKGKNRTSLAERMSVGFNMSAISYIEKNKFGGTGND